MMNRWKGVEEFVEVVNCGSFTAAALKLDVSTSHVSRQIDALEHRLNTRLLYRTTRKITLTEIGKNYFDSCNHLIEGFSMAEETVTQMQTKPQGILKITAPATFGENYIAPLANQFMQSYPELGIEFHFSNQIIDLVDEGFDLAIRTGILKDSSLMARRIAPRQLYVCASPAYLKQHRQPDNLQDLVKHNCLIGTLDVWQFQEHEQLKKIKVKGRWHGNSGSALVDATCMGLGLSQLPDYYVVDKIRRGELIPVLAQYQTPETAVWAIYPYNRHLSQKVRLFVDYISESFSQSLPWLDQRGRE